MSQFYRYYNYKSALYLLRLNLLGKEYGLRNYGKETEVVWDGKEGCEHEWRDEVMQLNSENRNGLSSGTVATNANQSRVVGIAKRCSLCKGWYGSLGLEPSYKDYIRHILQVTTELKRVLNPTGTFFFNLGDSYVANQGGASRHKGKNLACWCPLDKPCHADILIEVLKNVR